MSTSSPKLVPSTKNKKPAAVSAAAPKKGEKGGPPTYDPAERTTKAEVREAFESVAKALGVPLATSEADAGAWTLSHVPDFGGYRIHQITKDGGTSLPLGAARLSPGNFANACEMVLCALALAAKKNGAKS